jgi:hypothetical protein
LIDSLFLESDSYVWGLIVSAQRNLG